MSDFSSSLPVRTENNGDFVAKIADGSTSSQQLAVDTSGRITVRLDDGTGNTLTSQVNGAQRALDVGLNVAGIQVDPRSIRALTSSDIVSVVQSTSPWVTSISNDVNYGTVGSNTLRSAAQVGNATGAADFNNGATGAQTLRTAANLAIGGANVSSTNPIPVTISSVSLGAAVNDYHTAASVAAASSDNHDYIITTGKTFQGRVFWASASGRIKAEIQISPDGSSFTSKWVGFNSSANPNISINLDNLFVTETGTGSKIRMIITNEDTSAMDVYSTISGTES